MIWEVIQNGILEDGEEENQPRMIYLKRKKKKINIKEEREIEKIINSSNTIIERKKF